MEILKEKLNKLVDELAADKQEIVKTRLANLVSVYPFNEYEFIISSLVGLGRLSLDDYYEIRDEYIARNMFLYIFEIGSHPRCLTGATCRHRRRSAPQQHDFIDGFAKHMRDALRMASFIGFTGTPIETADTETWPAARADAQ